MPTPQEAQGRYLSDEEALDVWSRLLAEWDRDPKKALQCARGLVRMVLAVWVAYCLSLSLSLSPPELA